MANIITNTLIANITAVEDVTQAVPINRSNGNPAIDALVAQFTEAFVLTTNPTVITLPTSPCFQVYIRNVDPNGRFINVNWTPTGQTLVTVADLYPGEQIILWQKQGNANAGITALSIGVQTGPTIVEMFLGG